MPLEIYVYHPKQLENHQWNKLYTVYPGEEVQIPSVTKQGKMEMMRVQVKPDDSMSTVHTIFPEEIIIRNDSVSDLPSQIVFNPNDSENLPHQIKKGQYIDVFSRMFIHKSNGKLIEEISRGRLFHR